MKEHQIRKFTLKVFFSNGVIKKVYSKKLKRIYANLQAVKKLEVEKYYIKVDCGPITDNFGRKVSGINEGYYRNQRQLKLAIKAFTE